MITLLVPSYNEGKNILIVLDSFKKISTISQTIVIDDGSSDNTESLIRLRFPDVELIRMPRNLGKSEAVRTGLKKALNPIILLFDADIRNINTQELKAVIVNFCSQKNLDMLILENKGSNNFIDTLLRKNIVLSGKRLIHKHHLEDVYKEFRPHGYQLELAINKYMSTHKKNVKWVKDNAYNPHKIVKTSFINGLQKESSMQYSIVSFMGFYEYLKQLLFFCREELK